MRNCMKKLYHDVRVHYQKETFACKTEVLGNLIDSGCNCLNFKAIMVLSKPFETWIKEE